MAEVTAGSAHRENVCFAPECAGSLARPGVGLLRPFARYMSPGRRSPVMFRHTAWVLAAQNSQSRPWLKRHIPHCNSRPWQRPGPIGRDSNRPMDSMIDRWALACVRVRCSRQPCRHAGEADDPSPLPSGICPWLCHNFLRRQFSWALVLDNRIALDTERDGQRLFCGSLADPCGPEHNTNNCNSFQVETFVDRAIHVTYPAMADSASQHSGRADRRPLVVGRAILDDYLPVAVRMADRRACEERTPECGAQWTSPLQFPAPWLLTT